MCSDTDVWGLCVVTQVHCDVCRIALWRWLWTRSTMWLSKPSSWSSTSLGQWALYLAAVLPQVSSSPLRPPSHPLPFCFLSPSTSSSSSFQYCYVIGKQSALHTEASVNMGTLVDGMVISGMECMDCFHQCTWISDTENILNRSSPPSTPPIPPPFPQVLIVLCCFVDCTSESSFSHWSVFWLWYL